MNGKGHWRGGITYFLCFGAGAFLWPLMGRPGDSQAAATQSPKGSPAEVEVKRRLAELVESNRKSRERNDEPEGSFASSEVRAKEWLERWPEKNRIDRAHLAELIARSGAYRSVVDLRPALSDAMATDDQQDSQQEETAAIFLEWYRRDPKGALDEMARRYKSRSMFIFQDTLFLHFPLEEAARELSDPHRPDEFRAQFIDGIAKRLAESDDLHGLIAVMEKLDAQTQKSLAVRFVTKDWVPRDGAKASEILGNEMPEPARKLLLGALASTASSYLCDAWTEGPGKDLIERTLGPAEIKRLAEEALPSEDRSPGHGEGEDSDEYSDSPVTALQAGLSAEEAVSGFSERISIVLAQEKDYRECFATGGISAAEIFADINRKIPGSEAYPGALARALYRELAPYDPGKAAAWGRETIPVADFANDTRSIIQYTMDPRASRITELIRQLPATLPQDDQTEWFSDEIRSRFHEWKVLDPDAARTASESIPASHPLRDAVKGGEKAEEEEP